VVIKRKKKNGRVYLEEFKGVLAEKGLNIKVESLSDEDFDEGLKLIKDIRENSKW
jgi:hypothetical protein